uniref:Uncharacterized protein n=1 Tax=Steinernema glaseri TaxID=37863 RepID=A0A1I7ZJ34_9BILA
MFEVPLIASSALDELHHAQVYVAEARKLYNMLPGAEHVRWRLLAAFSPILAPMNDTCFALNADILNRMAEEARTYLSTVRDTSGDNDQYLKTHGANHNIESIHQMTPTGLPPHDLTLKVTSSRQGHRHDYQEPVHEPAQRDSTRSTRRSSGSSSPFESLSPTRPTRPRDRSFLRTAFALDENRPSQKDGSSCGLVANSDFTLMVKGSIHTKGKRSALTRANNALETTINELEKLVTTPIEPPEDEEQQPKYFSNKSLEIKLAQLDLEHYIEEVNRAMKYEQAFKGPAGLVHSRVMLKVPLIAPSALDELHHAQIHVAEARKLYDYDNMLPGAEHVRWRLLTAFSPILAAQHALKNGVCSG